MKKKIELVCKSVAFYSAFDDDAFFEWVKKISCVSDMKGVGDKLYLYVNGKRIKREDLRELVALFYRYDIDMKQLVIFLNKKNKPWFFDNKISFWHKKIFS